MGHGKLLLILFAVVGLSHAQLTGVARSGKQPVDTLAPTHGVKSAEEIAPRGPASRASRLH
jgi:hypothetical protein